MSTIAPATDADDVLFSAVLEPHRSADNRTIRNVGLFMAAIFVPVGVGLVVAGAWPVIGFMGLEVVALVALLRWHHNKGFAVETIALTRDRLRIERRDPWGRRRAWSFPPHWLQVNIDHSGNVENRLELRSHGNAVVIGTYMTPDERLTLAAALRDKLRALTGPDMTAARV